MATKSLQILGSLNQTAVQFVEQELTEEEKAQARENIGAAGLDDVGNGSGGVTSWNDLEDKPFYDARVRSYYSQAENPNPVSFDIASFQISAYKVSDLAPVKSEFSNTTFISYGVEKKLKMSDITTESNEFISVQFADSTQDAYIIAYTTGVVTFEFSGYTTEINIPEIGTYYLNSLGAGVYPGTIVEIYLGELNTLDPKFISDMYYDTRVMSYYSQAENPHPPQIDNAMMNMSFYKVSDLILTRDEIFNNCKVIINGGTREFEENAIQLETDDFIYVITNDGTFNFIFVNKSGTLNFTYSGYPMSIEVPEGGEGIYYQRGLNEGVPEGRTIEFIIGGELKQIDPKFIPDEIARKSDLDDVSVDLSNYYTKLETYSQYEIDNKISNVKVDLSGYYTKNEVYNKSEIDEITGDINTVLDEISNLIGE
jgi:hypothetical protein